MTKKVFIIQSNPSYNHLFEELGFTLHDSMEGASLIVFTGGEDVNPALYDQPVHKSTWYNLFRDTKEAVYFNRALELGIPMVGICRGGQFLNVMSGGEMYQDVSKHTSDHTLIDAETGETVWVTSTHHQMMKPSSKALVVAFADLHGWREVWDGQIFSREESDMDYEVLFYEENKALCFQPHPEFQEYSQMREYFKKIINKYLEV